MLTPSQVTWAAHGSPVVESCSEASGRCYLCAGEVVRGLPVAKWMGSNFTDQTRARHQSASHVCEACCYITSRTSPVLGRLPQEGKSFGANFRNVSHLWEEGVGYANASKGEKPAIRAFIEREHADPWFAVVADSAQKHVLPFATMNGPGRAGLVLLDETIVSVPEDVSLVAAMVDLLTAGGTKDEIERGDYRPATWQRCGDAAREFEDAHGDERGSPWFTLALWLAQRDEEAVAARQAEEKEARKNDRRQAKRTTRNADRGGAVDAPVCVPADGAGERAEALGHPTVASAGSGADDSESRGVGDQAPARPASPVTVQLSLFGAGGAGARGDRTGRARGVARPDRA